MLVLISGHSAARRHRARVISLGLTTFNQTLNFTRPLQLESWRLAGVG